VPRPTVILWLDAYPVCREATERAGLGNRVEPVTLAAAETPGDGLVDRIDPAGILARAPRLRWCAVLEVFRKEPLRAHHPFWATPGITVRPHLGALHPAQDAQVARLFVDNLARFVAGEPLAEVVDRQQGY
jgi:hypothetical protein